MLGSLEVAAVDIDSAEALWVRYADVVGIAEDDFREYDAGRELGVALGVRHVVALADPLPLAGTISPADVSAPFVPLLGSGPAEGDCHWRHTPSIYAE